MSGCDDSKGDPRAAASGKQFIFFAPLLDFSGVIKNKRMFKILIVASQAERRFLNHRFPIAGNFVTQVSVVE